MDTHTTTTNEIILGTRPAGRCAPTPENAWAKIIVIDPTAPEIQIVAFRGWCVTFEISGCMSIELAGVIADAALAEAKAAK